MHDFHPHALEIEYIQDEENKCCLSIMDSALFAANENVTDNDVVSRLSSYFSREKLGFKNMIRFTIDILADRARNNG